MRFRSKEHENLFRVIANDLESPLDSVVETYLNYKQDYVRRTRTWKKSQRTKHAWRKLRFKMRTAIRRYHRSPRARHPRRAVARAVREMRSRGFAPEGDKAVRLPLYEYERHEFLRSLSLLRASLYHEASFFDLEEAQIDFGILTDEIAESVLRVEGAVIREEPVALSDLEAMLALVGEDVLAEVHGSGDPVFKLGETEALVEAVLRIQETPPGAKEPIPMAGETE